MAKIYIESMDRSPGVGERAKDFCEKDDFCLQFELRHLFRTMAVFGLHHPLKAPKCFNSCIQAFTTYVQKGYCILIQIILWLNVIRLVVSFWIGDAASLNPDLFAVKLLMCVWSLQCAVNSTIWYFLCCSRKLQDLMQFWQTNCQSSIASYVLGTSIPVKWVRRKIRIMFAICMIIIVTSPIGYAVIRLESVDESLRNDTAVIVAPISTGPLAWEIVVITVLTFATGVFFLPAVFLLILCSILSHQFQSFTDKFTTCITDKGVANVCLSMMRRQHQYLAKTVFLADDALSFYLAISIAQSIFTACFGMYQLVIAQSFTSIISISMAVFWMALAALFFGFVGLYTARVNEKVSQLSK